MVVFIDKESYFKQKNLTKYKYFKTKQCKFWDKQPKSNQFFNVSLSSERFSMSSILYPIILDTPGSC